MRNLKRLEERDLIDKAESAALFDQYAKRVKFLSYAVDFETNEITLFTHAPIPFVAIENLAGFCGIEYKDANLHELCRTIDKINAKFHANPSPYFYRVQHDADEDTDVWNDNASFVGMVRPMPKDVRYASAYFAWNRRDTSGRDDMKSEHNGYKIRLVHGHEGEDLGEELAVRPANIVNTDTNTGKYIWQNKGDEKYAAYGKIIIAQDHGVTGPVLVQSGGKDELVHDGSVHGYIGALSYYIATREHEQKCSGRLFNGCRFTSFFKPSSISAVVKLLAARKLLTELDGTAIERLQYSDDEILALHDSRLGRIVSQLAHDDSLPEKYQQCDTAHAAKVFAMRGGY